MFGERESEFSVVGYVPSLKKEGPIRAGSDQLKATALIQEREAAKDQAEVGREAGQAGRRKARRDWVIVTLPWVLRGVVWLWAGGGGGLP